MRTILAFVLTAAVFGQAPPSGDAATIERLEKKLADSTATTQDRVTLVNRYFTNGNIEGRRKQVLWLIENHPEIPEHRSPAMLLETPMPAIREAATQAAELWREQGSKPGASPKIVANAAWFLRMRDSQFAIEIIARAQRENPNDPDLARMRGVLDAITIGGLLDGNFRPVDPGTGAAIRHSPQATEARAEIETSREAPLLAGAADTILQQQNAFNDAPAMRDEDPLAAAQRWLLRAQEIDPKNAEVPRILSRVYDRQAGQTADPGWRVEVYRKADALDPNYGGLPALAMAEFEAGQDDAAARDAHRVMERKNPNALHIAHTILGRIALAHDDVATAKSELMASIPAAAPSLNLEPNRTLAQDLLDKGERDAVLQFFERFRAIWQFDEGSIDHYIRVIKAPGHPDLLTRYQAGQGVRGSQPKIGDQFSGKVVAIQFRNASCKTCDAELELMKRIAAPSNEDRVVTTIDAADNNPLVSQLDIATYPTVVFIGRDGAVQDYLAGNVQEQRLRTAFDRVLSGPGGKLPAPNALSSESSTTLAWSPVSGAESYVVQLDQRDAQGWLSDRDEQLVRVIPAHATAVTLDPSLGETAAPVIRWRVFAVTRTGPGIISDWREIRLVKP
jgi:thiol-disulfide isomerase/thioredoxin